jgi:hypothetical protein
MKRRFSDRPCLPVSVMGAALLMCSCATMVRDWEQPVTFTSDPPGARLLLDSALRGTTPAVISVMRSPQPVTVRLEKDGYHPETFVLEEHMHPMVMGNILIGGVIGLGIDAASGKSQDYVDSVHVRLKPMPESLRSRLDGAVSADSRVKEQQRRLMARYHEGGISRQEYLRQLRRIEPWSR